MRAERHAQRVLCRWHVGLGISDGNLDPETTTLHMFPWPLRDRQAGADSRGTCVPGPAAGFGCTALWNDLKPPSGRLHSVGGHMGALFNNSLVEVGILDTELFEVLFGLRVDLSVTHAASGSRCGLAHHGTSVQPQPG